MNKYMESINTISGVLIKSKNKVLLCKRAPKNTLANMWSIPCGHLEKNEPPLIGAKREFYEETNVEIYEEIKLCGFIRRTTKDNKHTKGLMYVFLLNVDEKIFPDLKSAKDGFEHTECGYFSLKNLPFQNQNDKLAKLIVNILSKS